MTSVGFRGNSANSSSACSSISSSMITAGNNSYSSTVLARDDTHALEALASATEKTRSKKTRPLSHALEASGTENRQPFQDVTNTTNAACNTASQSTEATVAQSQFLAVIPEWDGCSPDQIMKRLKLLEEEELQKLGI
jgi:hypothetical protein